MLTDSSGAVLYCGNIMAAQAKDMLKKHNIGLIVNTQGTTTTNFFENDPNFPVKVEFEKRLCIFYCVKKKDIHSFCSIFDSRSRLGGSS